MTLPLGLTVRYSPFNRALAERLDAADSWLGAAERCELEALRDAARRRQWLAGRWLSKQLIGEALGIDDLVQVDVLSRDKRGRGVTPRALSRSHEMRFSLSISHTELGVLVALAKTSRLSVGVDLAPREVPAHDGFFRLWFTSFERQWISHDPDKRLGVVWAAKEAVYKAINSGRPWNPRQIEIRHRGPGGFECSYRGRPLEGMSIEMTEFDGQLAAIACLRRNARKWHTDGPSRPQPAGASRRTVLKPRQRPRFVVCGYPD